MVAELPDEVLTLICRAVLAKESSTHPVSSPTPLSNASSTNANAIGGTITSPSLLLTLNRRWHAAASRVLYESLVLPDDNLLLVLASQSFASGDGPDHGLPKVVHKLRAILNDVRYASSVSSLRIIPSRALHAASAAGAACAAQIASIDQSGVRDPILHWKTEPSGSVDSLPSPFSAEDDNDDDVNAHEHLDDLGLYNVIKTRLSGSIREFTWSPTRAPPDIVIEALSRCEVLNTFSAWSPSVAANGQQHVASNENSDSPAPSVSYRSASLPSSAQTASTPQRSLVRWDASCIDLLPATLQRMELSHLSAEAVRVLQGMTPTLHMLESLIIDNCLTVDDALLASIADHCVRLKKLALRQIAGTKVTDKGIAALMEKSSSLEHFEMVDVQGRLSKRCWQDIDIYPLTLRAVSFSFSEDGVAHHSWITDHLCSADKLVEKLDKLEHFSVTRIVPAKAELPFQHDKVSLANPLLPGPIPDKLLQALVQRARSLKVVELDLWEMSSTDVKTLLDACSRLQRGSFMLDAPISKLLTMSPSSVLADLREIKVSIPPRHTPSLSTACTIAVSSNASPVPSRQSASHARTRSRQVSNLSTSSLIGSTQEGVPKEAIPPLRDVKKLAKRCPLLERLEWSGRGGVGSWTFDRRKNPKDPKVSFVPITECGTPGKTEETDLFGDTIDAQTLLALSALTLKRPRGLTSSSASSDSIFGYDDSSSSMSDHTMASITPHSPVMSTGLQSPTSVSEYRDSFFDDAVTPQSLHSTRRRSISPEALRRPSVSNEKESSSGGIRYGRSRSATADSPMKTDSNGRIRIVHGGGWTSKKIKIKGDSAHARRVSESASTSTAANIASQPTKSSPGPFDAEDTDHFPDLASSTQALEGTKNVMAGAEKKKNKKK